jgi:dienelactone hydrolase
MFRLTLVLLMTVGLALPPPCPFSLISAARAEPQDRSSDLMQVAAPDRSGRQLQVRVLRPAGEGPFPIAVINHGSPESGSKRTEMQVPTFRVLSEWLLARGYLVALPLRRGYGVAGGRWDESYGRCERPDYVAAGSETARDIEAVIAALSNRPFVQKSKTVVFGQSAGGWGSLALASRNPPNVIAYVNFAGGRGGHRNGQPHSNCAPEELVHAAAQFGRTARQPTLWLYAENDSYFAPGLARQMQQAFVQAGGRANLLLLPPVGEDGHRLISAGAALWGPAVEKFLRDLR